MKNLKKEGVKLRVIISGGGTAGHINPALAIAGYLREKEKDMKILYVGAKGGMEEKLVKQAGFDFKGITISGFSRKLNFEGIKKNIITFSRIFTSSNESKKIINEFKPDICIGTGGYVSGPILQKAAQMKIPIIIHEQNAYPGLTTKMLSKHAKCVMLAIKDAEKYFDKSCIIKVTGNPIRKEIITTKEEQSRAKLGFDSRPVILSFGGSLGARAINEAIIDLIAHTSKDNRYQHIHGYGQHSPWFIEKLSEHGVNLKLHKNIIINEYINNMPECLAAADLVICRSGAITLSEIQAKGKAAILIPSPNVAENHQYHNAMALVNNNAASIIEEKDLTSQRLIDTVERMLKDKKTLATYKKNASKMAVIDSNERIYKIIKDIIK